MCRCLINSLLVQSSSQAMMTYRCLMDLLRGLSLILHNQSYLFLFHRLALLYLQLVFHSGVRTCPHLQVFNPTIFMLPHHHRRRPILCPASKILHLFKTRCHLYPIRPSKHIVQVNYFPLLLHHLPNLYRQKVPQYPITHHSLRNQHQPHRWQLRQLRVHLN